MFAGARGFDGRIQRQQVGLLGDGLNQVEHAVDALGRRGETLDFRDGFFGPQSRFFDDAGGLADLPADFLDGSRQLFGGAGNGVDVAGGLLGGVGGGNGAAAGREWGDNDANRAVRSALNKDLEAISRVYAERGKQIARQGEVNRAMALLLTCLGGLTLVVVGIGVCLLYTSRCV